MRTTLCLALLALLALAGCTDDEPTDAAGPAGGADGDGTMADIDDGGATGDGGAGTATPVEEPLHLEGQTPVGGCFGVGGVVGQCQNMMAQSNYAILGDGKATSLVGTLTWDTTAQTGTMFAMLLVCEDGVSNCNNDGSQPVESGGSPLAIDWDLTDYEGESIAIWIVQYTGQGTSVGYALASTPVEFTFDGVVTSLDG